MNLVPITFFSKEDLTISCDAICILTIRTYTTRELGLVALPHRHALDPPVAGTGLAGVEPGLLRDGRHRRAVDPVALVPHRAVAADEAAVEVGALHAAEAGRGGAVVHGWAGFSAKKKQGSYPRH